MLKGKKSVFQKSTGNQFNLLEAMDYISQGTIVSKSGPPIKTTIYTVFRSPYYPKRPTTIRDQTSGDH